MGINDIIFQKDKFRIVEQADETYKLDELKGDCFDAFNLSSNLSVSELHRQEVEFEQKVELEGVYGYVLEEWNAEIDGGWTHVDSCWGFVGRHETENHYIINEFKQIIDDRLKSEES